MRMRTITLVASWLLLGACFAAADCSIEKNCKLDGCRRWITWRCSCAAGWGQTCDCLETQCTAQCCKYSIFEDPHCTNVNCSINPNFASGASSASLNAGNCSNGLVSAARQQADMDSVRQSRRDIAQVPMQTSIPSGLLIDITDARIKTTEVGGKFEVSDLSYQITNRDSARLVAYELRVEVATLKTKGDYSVWQDGWLFTGGIGQNESRVIESGGTLVFDEVPLSVVVEVVFAEFSDGRRLGSHREFGNDLDKSREQIRSFYKKMKLLSQNLGTEELINEIRNSKELGVAGARLRLLSSYEKGGKAALLSELNRF